MSYFKENQGEVSKEAQFQQQLMDEPMYNVDKYFIMNETQTFNHAKFSNDNSRKILVKLIYLVNQGIQFSECEVEQLFFRITKLFQSNSSSLRVMVYKSLKMIMPQKHVHVLIQSLIKDLISDNKKIKLEALKFIPFIQNEQYFQQIERFAHNALIDTNQYISNTALIVGIHIINKYSNVIGKWLFDVVQRLDEPKENIAYHALILFHEIKKQNFTQFIQIIIQLMNQPLQPLIQQQLIKFTEELFKILDIEQKKIIVGYLIPQMSNPDPLIFFQSALILIKIQEIENIQLQPIISRLITILSINDFQLYLQKFIALNLIEKVIRISRRKKLLQGKIQMNISTYSFSHFNSISAKSLQICVSLLCKNAVIGLKKQYNSNVGQQAKYNFLNGLLELIISHPTYETIVINFIEMTDIKLQENKFVYIVLKLLEQIQMNSNKNVQIALDTIFKVSEAKIDLPSQFQVVRLIAWLCFDIEIKQSDFPQTSLIYQFIKNKLLIERKYKKITKDQCEFIRRGILKMQNCKKRVQLGQISSNGVMDNQKFENQNFIQHQISNGEKKILNRYIQMQDLESSLQ
ncbi:hypothetical protein pb186bvf_000828 [Paramecium bursaria]